MVAMLIFCAWKVLAFSIHSFSVVEMVDMERIIVAICWSMRVVSSEILALAARFWKLVINFWNPSLKVPSSFWKDF